MKKRRNYVSPMLLLQGIDYGTLYYTVTPECAQTLKDLVNQPDDPFWEILESDDGVEPSRLMEAIQRLEPGIASDGGTPLDVYYDPENDEVWAEALMSLDIELDCGPIAFALINSHQGVGGM